MPRFSRLGWRALVALALLASSVSAQTVIETQGSEVDWQFAFIVSACLAGFLFIIVVVQFIYIRISIRKHKELRTSATDTRVEEVDLNMPDAYMDVQGVSRSHNSTAHSAGAKSPVETRVDDDEDDDNDV
ncbi:hypothetical protein PTSG_08383 [Salpingoeca rosetta]|uniref:Uncharacterized protein n=1 Tax=Salpingoeca rosetta (strain ATCC 50818 / BSB-021) TaxID=946362 RepID=F2UJJ1_SALR5|nr:uncharacterized protein PTSG_08383 [Salpingoeca rosetta]EGD77290.1 hypothetical protein PTSG_08383 [Salpingoeca rosetta]|eukprot:XP_004990634.1 hypothetical protein PTSG_08383 [Salpingoeca rosetta]